ncbi:MAG: trigger factor [Flavobacteriales bacterium]|nr:trigger factor [Flavobacteriales bacterium]|tara:strand:+ start:17843 stop:19195 length:1353 start_codon:yes stop_codon:yes gene_type:complete
MKLTQSKTKDLMATITVDVKAVDYTENVDKVLKNYRKTAEVPGFRKGKTPMGIINKKYRTGVVVEEVNKLIQDELYKHITTEKVRVLGSPMPIDETDIDWNNSEDFTFKYEVGIAPDFDVKITQKDKLNYYTIKADEKLVNNYCNDIAKRFGKMSSPDLSEESDLIFCIIKQLDVEGNVMQEGISNEATVSMDYISDKKIRKQFIGVRTGDSFNVNVMKGFKNHHDLAAMLNVTHDQLHDLTSDEFHFEVKTISRLIPAELNNELFDKVYGVGVVKDKKQFKAKVKDESEAQFLVESDKMLKNDVVNYFIKKLKLKMPDEFLKRWLVQTSKQPITMEMLESEYDMYSKSLQWQLIENKILEMYKIKVTQEDIIEHTKKIIALQMKQYGQPKGDDKQLTDIASNILKKEEERKKVYDQIFDERTLAVYKEEFKITEKTVTYDEFVKLASEK